MFKACCSTYPTLQPLSLLILGVGRGLREKWADLIGKFGEPKPVPGSRFQGVKLIFCHFFCFFVTLFSILLININIGMFIHIRMADAWSIHNCQDKTGRNSPFHTMKRLGSSTFSMS